MSMVPFLGMGRKKKDAAAMGFLASIFPYRKCKWNPLPGSDGGANRTLKLSLAGGRILATSAVVEGALMPAPLSLTRIPFLNRSRLWDCLSTSLERPVDHLLIEFPPVLHSHPPVPQVDHLPVEVFALLDGQL